MTLLHVLLLSSLAGAADSPPTTAPAERSGGRPVSEQQVEQWMQALGHPRYAIREEATQQLCAMDAQHLPLLMKHYRAESRYEMKRRIRYVVEYIFHRDQIVGRDGFMGIILGRTLVAELTDPVTNDTTLGVSVMTVKPEFAAARAGMKDNDVIIAFENKPIPQDQGTQKFVQMVQSHRPGTTIALRVLRAGEVRKITMEVKADPTQAISGAKFSAMPPDMAANPQGVWVSGVAPGSEAAASGMRANEILRSVDGKPVDSPQFEALLRAPHPGGKMTLEVARTEVVPLTVTLGTRPPELIDANMARDKAEAQARFLQWWQDQGGDLSTRPPELTRGGNQSQNPRVAPETSVIP